MIAKSLMSTIIKIFAPIVVAALVVLIYLYSTRSKSVLYRFEKSAAKSIGGPSFSLFNPFRDRGPEQKAEAFLERVRAQPCPQVLTDLALDQDTFKYLCEKEDANRLISWRLADREEMGNKAKMFYWTRRSPSGSSASPLWVTIEKTGNQWKVVDYEGWY
jgi:hypothetical protein